MSEKITNDFDIQICPECGANVRFKGMKYCKQCGLDLYPLYKICSNCGSKVPYGVANCRNCNYDTTKDLSK